MKNELSHQKEYYREIVRVMKRNINFYCKHKHCSLSTCTFMKCFIVCSVHTSWKSVYRKNEAMKNLQILITR